MQIPWEQAKQEFLKEKASVNRSTTAGAYDWSLKAFQRVIKPNNLAQIDVGVLGRFAAARMDEGMTAETVNKDLRAVRAFLHWAVGQPYLVKAPSFKAAWVREDEKRPVVIPRAEYEAMLAALDSGQIKLTKRSAAWWKVFVQLAYGLGMRRGELLGLRWESVDLEKAEPELTVLSVTSKGRRYRTLPLVPELVAVLRAWRESCPGEERVLPYDGDMRRLYSDWHRFAGDRVPKNCRSSTGSQLVEAGTPTVVVKDFLGHSSVVTTERFYTNTTGALRKAADARRAN